MTMYLPTKSLRTKPRQLALCLAAVLLLIAFGPPAAAQPVPETLVYEQDYDEGGRVRTLTPDSGRTATYTYSDAGSEKTLDYAGWPVVTATEFDVHGLPIRTERAALGAAPGAVETATRDDIGRLASHRLDIDGDASAAFDASGFAYDARGYLTGYVRNDAGLAVTQTFGYDGQARLASWSVGGATQFYGYDAFGNLESRSALSTPDLAVSALAALYDASNRRVGWDYDAEGRLARDDRYDYRYDRSGRLAAIFTHDGDLVAHYLYDLGGQRIRVFEDGKLTFTQRDFAQRVVSERVVDLETGAVTGEDHLLFAGQAVATVDDQPSPMGELVATQRFTDRLGNPALRWDGEGDRHYQDYAPFGTQARVADPEHEGAHGFTGHEDDATGNTYMRARYYDPDASRFQRPDPARDFTLASPSSLNLYQYVRNQPLDLIDPTGRITIGFKFSVPILKRFGINLSVGVAASQGKAKGDLGDHRVDQRTFQAEAEFSYGSKSHSPIDEVTTPYLSESADKTWGGFFLGTGYKQTTRSDGTIRGEVGLFGYTLILDDKNLDADVGASGEAELTMNTPLGSVKSDGKDLQTVGEQTSSTGLKLKLSGALSHHLWKSYPDRYTDAHKGKVDSKGLIFELKEK